MRAQLKCASAAGWRTISHCQTPSDTCIMKSHLYQACDVASKQSRLEPGRLCSMWSPHQRVYCMTVWNCGTAETGNRGWVVHAVSVFTLLHFMYHWRLMPFRSVLQCWTLYKIGPWIYCKSLEFFHQHVGILLTEITCITWYWWSLQFSGTTELSPVTCECPTPSTQLRLPIKLQKITDDVQLTARIELNVSILSVVNQCHYFII